LVYLWVGALRRPHPAMLLGADWLVGRSQLQSLDFWGCTLNTLILLLKAVGYELMINQMNLSSGNFVTVSDLDATAQITLSLRMWCLDDQEN
jgi:hypothetical protein